MNLLDFNKRFPDEASCVAYLKLKREEECVICHQCHTCDNYWLQTMLYWKCKQCGAKTHLKAGTLMEKTHIPLRTWFTVIHLMTSTKKAFSALEMQRQVGLKFYEPVWFMMQKIRISMGKRDAKYRLQGNIEIDDAFYEVVDLPDKNILGEKIDIEKAIKRGRGSERQAKVLVMVESKPNPKQTNPHKKNRILGFVKMISIDNLNNIGIEYEVRKAISPTSIVISDGYRGYSGLSEIVKEHNAMVVPQKEAQ